MNLSPVLNGPKITNIPDEDLSKVYVFTNGVQGKGLYGGGPFMYQIDIFDSIPSDSSYSQFRIPYLVTWNEDSSPRVLTSVDQLLDAEKKGHVTIQPTSNVVNAPIIVWKENNKLKTAEKIPQIFQSMTDVEGKIIMADTSMYITKVSLHPTNQTNMMDMMK